MDWLWDMIKKFNGTKRLLNFNRVPLTIKPLSKLLSDGNTRRGFHSISDVENSSFMKLKPISLNIVLFCLVITRHLNSGWVDDLLIEKHKLMDISTNHDFLKPTYGVILSKQVCLLGKFRIFLWSRHLTSCLCKKK